jgi:hypothetical protein
LRGFFLQANLNKFHIAENTGTQKSAKPLLRVRVCFLYVYNPKSNCMKFLSLKALARVIGSFFNSLFVSKDSREFKRLKDFIAN